MLASFSIVPLGVGEELKQYIAGLVSILEESKLSFQMGAMQTTLEGDADRVMDTILRCHRHMRTVAPRVLTTITLDDRAGAEGRLTGKVKDVESVLGRSLDQRTRNS